MKKPMRLLKKFCISIKVLTPLLSSLLYASALSAEVVTVDGYGDDFESAVRNAKLAAIENVVGTFIIGGREWQTDDSVFEKVKEYHGGYIKSYDVLEYKNDRVTIKADVERIKDNSLHVGGNTIDMSQFKPQIDNYNSRRAIIEELDDPRKAFNMKINSVRIDPKEHKYQFRINGTIQWQPKWVSDLETFVFSTQDEGKIHTNLNDNIASGTFNLLNAYGPAGAVLGSVAHSAIKVDYPTDNTSMVCFAKTVFKSVDYCYDLAGGFKKMPIYSEMPTSIIGKDKDGKEIFNHRINIKSDNMYETIHKGQTKKRLFSEITFDQPGYIIYSDAERVFTVLLDINADIAANIETLIVEPR